MSTIGNEIRSRFTFEENKIPKVSYVVVNESSEEKQVLMNVDSEEGFGFVPFHLTSDFDFSVGALQDEARNTRFKIVEPDHYFNFTLPAATANIDQGTLGDVQCEIAASGDKATSFNHALHAPWYVVEQSESE